MHKRLVFIIAAVCVLAFAASTLAGPPAGTKWMISYDGYLDWHNVGDPFSWYIRADTLIVVTNSHPSTSMHVFIDVFDKDGIQVGTRQTLYDGGFLLPNNQIPPNSYGWTTLSMIVDRDTQNPWGSEVAEKFSFRIYTAPSQMPPVVEVKQVVYLGDITFEGAPFGIYIWSPENYYTWTETSLGGLHGTGVVLAP